MALFQSHNSSSDLNSWLPADNEQISLKKKKKAGGRNSEIQTMCKYLKQ